MAREIKTSLSERSTFIFPPTQLLDTKIGRPFGPTNGPVIRQYEFLQPQRSGRLAKIHYHYQAGGHQESGDRG